MIILYDTTETKFESNGLGVLDHDIINPIIEESANGTFKLSFDYPLSGVCGNRIGRRMYIKADDPDTQGNIFKIYNFEKSDGILSVVAFQIANEFNNNWIEHTNIFGKNGQSALDQMKSNLTNSTRFNFYSDILATANSEVVRLNPLTWLIDSSTDNSFVNRWGGEIKRDGFNIRMFKQRGADNGVQIRWRKNLSSYNVKWDDTTVITRIRPVGYNGLTLPELYVDSPKLAKYGDPIIKEVKYDDIKLADENTSSDNDAYKTVDEAYTALRKAAAKEFSENHLDDPTVTADVSMISLKNTREYADVAELETIKQWDTIQLINERDNVNIQMRLNSYKYNPLNHEFIELKFVSTNQALTSGNTNLSSVINGISSTVKNVQDTANQAQISANGKNMIDRGTADPNKLTFNGTLTDGDIYYRTNGDKKEMWFYSAKDKAWKLEVSDMTGQEIEDEVSQVKQDADKMRADAEAQLAGTEKQISDINLDLNKANDDIKSVDAKFNSKTDILNQAVTNVKSDLAEQVDNLKQAKANADQALSKANNVNSSVSTINAEIDKVNATLQLKAEKSDINTINKTVTNQQAQIDANTKGITLKADQTSVNTLNQTVTNQASKLSILAGEMDQKTSKTEFNNLTGRVTNAEQQIKANSDGVTSTVSKVNQIQDQVNNSAVGTNLLVGTSSDLVTVTNATGWGSHLPDIPTNRKDLTNQTYTARAYIAPAKHNACVYIGITFNDGTYKNIAGSTISAGSSGYSTLTTPVPSNGYINHVWLSFTSSQTDSTSVSYKEMKLEKGSHATDWSPNPADNATTTALNIIKQTADETYQGLFNADGSNKIDKTAQGLTAQIKTAQNNAVSTAATDASNKANSALNSAKSYADTTVNAKAGEITTKLSSVQTTLQDDATNKANSALNSAKSYANDKVNNLAIGGTNLIPLGNIVTATSTQTAYDSTNDIRTLTIANGAGGSWGGGLQNNSATKHEIPWGQSYTYSVEIMPDVDGLTWNSDANFFPISGQSWSGNDNDAVNLRVDGGSNGGKGTKLIPNIWNRVWVTVINSNSANTNKVSLYDNSTLGVVNNTGKTVTVKFRHFKGEIGNKATDWSPAPEDVKNDAQSRANNALNSAKTYAETTIDAKAGSLMVDLKNYTVTQANSAKSAAISTASTDATNKANSAKSAAISTAANDAQSRANNALNSAKSYADTQISAKAGEISAKLTSIQGQVNSSAVGNNLLTGTSTPKVIMGNNTSNQSGFNYYFPDSQTANNISIKYGSTFTVSFDWSVTGNTIAGTFLVQYTAVPWGSNVSTPTHTTVSSSNKSGHIVATYTQGAGAANIAQGLGFRLDNFQGTLTISNMKLESGSHATPWCLAPSEVATQDYAQTLIDAKAGSLLVDLRNYATTQANSAKSAAISTASTDATNKANSALNSAKSAASTDASNKANNALNSAKSYADTQISATVGTLNAKVSGADYHNLISMNGNGILLDAHGVNNSNKSIILSGDHVKIDSNNPVIIPNAAIGSLDAGKIRGGTLNFANINAINLNADSIAAGTISGVAIHQSSSGHDTWIDGNGIHDYDSSGNNAWIQKGKLQVYDSNNYGFFMSAGELQLTSAASWSTSTNPMFGTIKRDSSIFSTSGNGMVIQGTDGLSMRSKSFKSFYGLVEQGSRYDGSGINIADSGILAASNGRISITGGTVYNEFLDKLPRIEIGTNRWDPIGTGGEAGKDIAMQADGVMIDVNGGIYVNSYTGYIAEFHNMTVKANSFNTTSQLSLKTNISKVDSKIALEKIRQTNIYDYQYKDDVEKGSKKHYASFIIDDVNEVSEYTEPEEFLSEDKTGRDDGTQLAYATVAIQELSRQIEVLKQEIENLKQK